MTRVLFRKPLKWGSCYMISLGGFDGCKIFLEKMPCTWGPRISLMCFKNAAQTVSKGKELLESGW